MKQLIIKLADQLGIYSQLKKIKELTIEHWGNKWQLKQYERKELYSKFINEMDLCFDLGANFGDDTRTLEELNARVISIEPVKICYKYLKKNFKSKKVTILNCAVGDKMGREIINICPSSSFSTMSKDYLEHYRKKKSLANLNWKEKQQVEVITLNYLCEKYGIPKFVKIDVEGYEYEVLKNLKYKIPIIKIEFNTEFKEIAISCVKKLSTLGKYEFNLALFSDDILFLEQWTKKEGVIRLLKELNKKFYFGNIYARLK
jgi:FkbM family methyltransferase